MKQVIYTASVELRGITSLLIHKCGIIETNKKTDKETDYGDEWLTTIYTSKEDKTKLVIPALNLEAMLRDASPGTKIGKNFLSKIITPGADIIGDGYEGFESYLLFNNNFVFINDIKKNDWLFSCAVVIGKSRVTRTRVCLPAGWCVKFRIKVYDKIINKKTLEELLIKAGDKEGLMEWRPGSPKPGKFGQFELENFKIC